MVHEFVIFKYRYYKDLHTFFIINLLARFNIIILHYDVQYIDKNTGGIKDHK